MYLTSKRAISFITAIALTAAMAGCGKSSSSSDEGSEGETTTTRKTITTAPVVETLGDLDLSDVQNKNDIPADFKYEAEAEDGELLGTAAVLDQNFAGDYSGSGFVSISSKNDAVEFEIEFKAEGSYDISITAAADKEGVSNLITVDGASLTSFKTNTTKFGENTASNVLIPKGKHKIGFKASNGLCYIDKLVITPAKELDLSQYEVSNTLSNPNASEETRRLYNFLTDVYGKYTISGQYSSNNFGADCREFIEIQDKTGKTPAILGLDLIESSPSRVANGSGGGDMVPLQAMDWWKNKGGIVSMCWHWNAPEPYLNYNGGAWFEGFYSEYTNFDLAAALNGSDPEGYDYLIRDIDAIAEILMNLDDNHVPILWRPLHEGGGDPKWKNPWFWWGSSGADAYIELWKLMYDRLTNVHNINNLIWVWNGQDPTYYPGDEYVDIIGYDLYPDPQDSSSQKDTYDLMKTVTDTNKIIAMTENGSLFDPDAAFNDGSRWAWFSTWNGEFTIKDAQLSGEYTSIDLWKKIYNSERVLTLDELPDLKNYPLDTEKFLAENGGQ